MRKLKRQEVKTHVLQGANPCPPITSGSGVNGKHGGIVLANRKIR